MNRGEMLDRCKEIVTKHRQTEHGTPEDSFKQIAAFWSAYLGREVTSCDVARMMILLKIARSMANNKNDDNYLDMAGYAACGVEIATTPDESEITAEAARVDALFKGPDGRRSQSGNHLMNKEGPHVGPLCDYKRRDNEDEITITPFADAVTCHNCLSIMGRITKESMGGMK